MLLDGYAYSNHWRSVHPAAKGLFAGLGLVAVLAAATPMVPLLVMAVMAGATLLGARIPVAVYLRLLLVPLGFLLIGSLGLIVSFGSADYLLGTVPLLNLPLGLSRAGLPQAGLVLARSLGAVTCLYLLALTTPMTEVIGVLRRLGVPRLLLELMVLTYRQIFIFLRIAREMTVAQQSRLGYANSGNSRRSLAALVANLYVRTHQRSRQLHQGLVARGYEDELRWLERELPWAGGQMTLAAVSGSLLVALAMLLPG